MCLMYLLCICIQNTYQDVMSYYASFPATLSLKFVLTLSSHKHTCISLTMYGCLYNMIIVVKKNRAKATRKYKA